MTLLEKVLQEADKTRFIKDEWDFRRKFDRQFYDKANNCGNQEAYDALYGICQKSKLCRYGVYSEVEEYIDM